jgi:ABC-2 type transport system ATP-binding protein
MEQLFLLPLDQVIDQYSTGMKKKLALLGVLKQDKPILILDEPFNGLDMETCRIIHLIILQLKEKGKTIIVTSHILETLTNLCDYIHLLEGGKVIKSIERKNFEDFVNQLNLSIEDKNMHLIKELIA